MSNASFTRDEIILALDALYFSGEARPSAQTAAMQNLSALLNRLPIHPKDTRRERFRTPSGVTNQILRFCNSVKTGKQNRDVSVRFVEIDAEFEGRRDELHRIAEAIRRNEKCFEATDFGSETEARGFPEGALLGHLHRVVEMRDSAKLIPGPRCEICQIDTAEIYPHSPNLMQLHLTVPITALDGRTRYGAEDFITVCPNCHDALHRRRPWLTRENCGALLR